MSARPIIACVLAGALALAAACGGGEDDRGQAQQVVRDFATAVNERDGERFCKELTTREYVEQVTQAKGDGAISQCETQIKQVRQPELKVVRVVKTSIDGDKATVTAQLEHRGRTQEQVFRLVKEDGDFRLTSGAAN